MVASILPADAPRPRGWGQKVKIRLFQNMVMLHIELKGIAHAATWWQILSPQTPPPPQYMLQMVALTTIHRRHNAQRSRNVTGWDQKFKIQRFQNMIMLHIKLNEIANAATRKHIFCPYTHPRPLGYGQMHKNMLLLFSENIHVAYLIRNE